jgi:ADP-heptose:LPS heptosyltransferase
VTERAAAAAERALAAAEITEPRRTVALVAAGSWPAKTWPLSHSALLARRLMAIGWPVVVLVGPGEEHVVPVLRRLAPGVRALPPLPDVAVLAAVVARLGAVIGTDSGPRHLAVAFGVPTFAWFGPADPRTWTPASGPHGWWWTELPCRACHRDSCPHWNCLPTLFPERAAALVAAHLESHVGTPAGLGPAARA